jgi:gamma-glutamylcyclotransferase (GGCT)/AIG2-like uncharacterized protein YtfP
MYHYGYGSNLNQDFLKQDCPSARYVMKAYLPSFEVQFRYWSKKRNGGISTIIHSPGELVHGVIYDVSVKDIEELDILESVPQGLYKRETFKVLGEDGRWYDADLYSVSEPKGPFTPSKSYVELMLEGAKEQGLASEYIKKIEGILSRSE